tara:strand:- start:1084 stop:1317 length:234 start_codon:yes stop_codon:yes gene_type:complete
MTNINELATAIDWTKVLYDKCENYAMEQQIKRISTNEIDKLVRDMPKLDADTEDICVVTVEHWLVKANLATWKQEAA